MKGKNVSTEFRIVRREGVSTICRVDLDENGKVMSKDDMEGVLSAENRTELKHLLIGIDNAFLKPDIHE